ncbi:MAG: hypothetical protein ACLFWB_09410 [Armatimonadota bacterium]
MTQIRKHRWIYLAILMAFVVTFAGCHGSNGGAAFLAWLFTGSWDGGDATLEAAAAVLVLMAMTLAVEDAPSGAQASDAAPTDGSAQFWANVDTDADGVSDDTIAFEGNWTRDGTNITVTTNDAAQAGVDSITLNLQMGATEADGLSGTIEYTRDGITYEGDIDFERFEER